MGAFRRFLLRLVNVVRPGRGEPDLTREVASHLALLEDEFRRRGMSMEDARLAAKRAFGGVEQTKEAHRDARSFRWLDEVARDVGHALRVFRRTPFFHTGIILTLAVGIGANAAVFSILRAVLLQPLPYRDPDRLVMIWQSSLHPTPTQQDYFLHGQSWGRGFLTPNSIADWRAESKDVLSDVAAIVPARADSDAQFDLVLSDRAERLHGALVTPNFFNLLGVAATRGRVFTSTDEQAGEPIAVVSDALWRSAFGADPAVIGRTVTVLAGAPRVPRTFTIVGVLPAAFRFTYPDETQIWALEPWTHFERRIQFGICCQAVGRLRPGVSFEAASARMAAIRTDLDNARVPRVIHIERIYDWIVGDTRPSLLLLGAVALLLFGITCATTANALLVRIAERRRELAVRASLGADRGRLVRQLFVEGAVLASAGAAAGTLMAAIAAPVIRALIPAAVPRADEIGVNGWVLFFAIAAAALVTLLAAAAPAWHGARVDPAPALKSASSTASGDRAIVRWRLAMVAVQVAIATLLLVSASLLLISFWRLGQVPLGFDGAQVLTVETTLYGQRYWPRRARNGAVDPSAAAALDAFRQKLVARVRALPGVLDAGVTSAVPFRGTDFLINLHAAGQTREIAGNERMVDPGYFTVMRIPLLHGRLFGPSDTATSRKVAIVSESYARQMFGSADPIGQKIAYDDPREVVGVVGDVRYVEVDKNPQPALYLPADQGTSLVVCLVARVAPNAGDLGPAIREVIHDLEPTVPAMKMTTIDQIVNESVANRRFYTTATSAFAAVALLLTLVGLVVIVARSVVERRRELAIRAALGATSARIVRVVMSQGLAPVFGGILAGVAGAFLAASALAQFLFQVEARTPGVYVSAALLVLTVATAAILIPSRRAATIDPAWVLRAE